jgi:ABC-2 type transport system ATP-binding protein
VDFEIAPGEITALLGPNGAGKTTLVSIAVGLRRPDAGRVIVNGIDVTVRPLEARRFVGYAPQELAVYPTVSVNENLVYFGELAGLRGQQLRRRVEEVAEALELTPLLERVVRELSGGEKRRVHTAMALLHRPPLLLLDEPTTGVDVLTRARVLEVVRSLAADGSAVCYSTHYLTEVEVLGADVAILDHGRVIARGSVADLVAAHGGSAVELAFEGEPPALDLTERTEICDGVVRIFTDNPAAAAAAALATLGENARLLRSIEVIKPSLEAVFLALTGRRYEAEVAGARETADVAGA